MTKITVTDARSARLGENTLAPLVREVTLYRAGG